MSKILVIYFLENLRTWEFIFKEKDPTRYIRNME